MCYYCRFIENVVVVHSEDDIRESQEEQRESKAEDPTENEEKQNLLLKVLTVKGKTIQLVGSTAMLVGVLASGDKNRVDLAVSLLNTDLIGGPLREALVDGFLRLGYIMYSPWKTS